MLYLGNNLGDLPNYHILPITHRALGAMADGLDEHMCLVRLADKEQVDLIELQSGLHRFMVSIQTWGFIWIHKQWRDESQHVLFHMYKQFSTHDMMTFKSSLVLLERADPRFQETIQFLFLEGRCWDLNGTYAALCLPLGFQLIKPPLLLQISNSKSKSLVSIQGFNQLKNIYRPLRANPVIPMIVLDGYRVHQPIKRWLFLKLPLRRRLQEAPLTIRLKQLGGTTSLKRLGGMKVEQRTLDEVSGRFLASIKTNPITISGFAVLWHPISKPAILIVMPIQARLSNWCKLVNASVRAEIPDYELMQTMASFLNAASADKTGDATIARLAKSFGLNSDARLWLGKNRVNSKFWRLNGNVVTRGYMW